MAKRSIPYIHTVPQDLPEEIRAFVRRPVRDGGILLVVGPRGSGKSRLVDEALNQRGEVRPWLHWEWWGGQGRDNRHWTLRQPRLLHRDIIQVNVEPYFPLPLDSNAEPCAAVGATEENAALDTPSQANEAAFQLIRNLVFALTSTVDPRWSARLHGRTLYPLLGFWRYWFSPHALLLREMGWCRWWGLLAMSLVFQALLVWASGFSGLPICPQNFWLLLPYTANFLLWYAVLRWRDWHALAHMSAKLYDLIHAQDMDETTRKERSLTSTWTHSLGLAHRRGAGSGRRLAGPVPLHSAIAGATA